MFDTFHIVDEDGETQRVFEARSEEAAWRILESLVAEPDIPAGEYMLLKEIGTLDRTDD